LADGIAPVVSLLADKWSSPGWNGGFSGWRS